MNKRTKTIHISSILLLLINISFIKHGYTQDYQTVYQKISQDDAYTEFDALIWSNRIAKTNLHHNDLTVFVPENDAFERYDGLFRSDLAFYHMSFEVKTVNLLRSSVSLRSVNEDNPPLWISKVGNDLYVNNAKILQEKSNYQARSRNDNGKQQVLHTIDEVLDPQIEDPISNPNAYDFLSSSSKWRIGRETVSSFLHKVQENRAQHVYKQSGGHTFFVPVDRGIDKYKYASLDLDIILSHVIPNFVLFTRPSEKNFFHQTLCAGDNNYIVVAFVEEDGKLYVKSSTVLGDSSHSKGELVAEIIRANIPVKNGVVHLISQPLGILERKLKPFPYLSVYNKFSGDPTLSIFFEMGDTTGFNNIFQNDTGNFTFFVPRDLSWRTIFNNNLETIESNKTILLRHLVVSHTPYSMEKLTSMSRANNFSSFTLDTVGGPLEILVQKIENEYYIKWDHKYVRVYRPDYECSDGIVHILEGPLSKFGKKGDSKLAARREVEDPGFWNTLKNTIESICLFC